MIDELPPWMELETLYCFEMNEEHDSSPYKWMIPIGGISKVQIMHYDKKEKGFFFEKYSE